MKALFAGPWSSATHHVETLNLEEHAIQRLYSGLKLNIELMAGYCQTNEQDGAERWRNVHRLGDALCSHFIITPDKPHRNTSDSPAMWPEPLRISYNIPRGYSTHADGNWSRICRAMDMAPLHAGRFRVQIWDQHPCLVQPTADRGPATQAPMDTDVARV